MYQLNIVPIVYTWYLCTNLKPLLLFLSLPQDTRGAVIQIADFMGRPLSDEIIDNIVGLVQVNSMKERFHSAGEKTDGKKAKKGALNLMRKGKLY